MPDADQIDLTRDRVWAVEVSVNYIAYVVAETADEAEEIANARTHDQDLERDYAASEVTEPPALEDGVIPFGRARWEGRELTVEEAVELVAEHQPAYDDQTELMPFADAPPPLYPPRIDDYLADQGLER